MAAQSASPGLSHRQFVVNVSANACYFALSIAIGLWYTPYVIRHLGVSVYGLIPLATSITSYLSVITVAVSGSVGRFITMDVARGDYPGANRTFNTFLLSSLILAGGLFFVALGFSYSVPHLFNVPAGEETQVRWLFISVMSVFLLSMVTYNFDASIWATSRFEIRSLLDGIGLVLRVGLVVVLFSVIKPQLWHVALAVFVAGVVWSGGHVLAWRRLTPYLSVRASDIDLKKLPELFYTTRWLFVSQLGTILCMNLDLALVNLLLGAETAGSYAPVLQWLMLLRNLCFLVAGVLAPTIVSFYARGDNDGMVRLSRQAMKFLGLLAALPVGLLCGLGKPVLETWLGASFTSMAPVAWLILLPMCIESCTLPLKSIVLATNRVRGMAFSMLGTGILNVLLALLLVRQFHWGVYGVAGAGAVASLCKNAVFYPLYGAAIIDRRRLTFYKEIVGIAAITLATAIVSWWASPLIHGHSWSRLILVACAIATPWAVVTYRIVLNASERQTIHKLLFQTVLKRA
jgi:membrane protein EpsK